MLRELRIRLLRRFASNEALAIVDLMLSDRPGWERDKYHLCHRGAGINLWIANAAYGLRFECIWHEPFPWIDRSLIWLHAKRFKWIDPVPGKVIERIEAAQSAVRQ